MGRRCFVLSDVQRLGSAERHLRSGIRLLVDVRDVDVQKVVSLALSAAGELHAKSERLASPETVPERG